MLVFLHWIRISIGRLKCLKILFRKIFTEKLLGKNISERIVFREAIQLAREGDQVIVEVVD